MHLLVDSTGLKIYGRRMARSELRYRIAPAVAQATLGVDADTHEIVAVELTPDDVGDVSEVPDLLDQIDADVASLTAEVRMMVRRSTMPWPNVTPARRSSFHRV